MSAIPPPGLIYKFTPPVIFFNNSLPVPDFKYFSLCLASLRVGTDTHLILLDLKNKNIDGMTPSTSSGQAAEKKLEAVGIIANRNSVPGDASPFKPSGLRLGTPALTSSGMKEKEMRTIAYLISAALNGASIREAKGRVLSLCREFLT